MQKTLKKSTIYDFSKRMTLKVLFMVCPNLPVLWAQIGKGVTLSRLANIRDSRAIILGSNACIERHSELLPMGGTIRIGDNTHLLPYAMLMGLGGDIDIGRYCTVNPFCVLYGGGGLKIGDSVRIASHTVIIPSNHIFDDPNTPIRLQNVRQKGVVIKDDVWVGTGVRILDGVTLGKGSVVAAGAVVTKTVPDYAIVTGVPALVSSWRKKEERVKTT